MAKYNNMFDWGGGFNIKGESPIDSRMIVDNINDLYDPNTWDKNNTPKYQGMPVVVLEDNSIYILKDVNNFDVPFGKTKIDLNTHITRSSGWAKVTGLMQKDIKELLDTEIEDRKSSDINIENKIVGKKTLDNGEVFNDYINNIAGNYAHAEGEYSRANGHVSHAEGYGGFLPNKTFNIITGDLVGDKITCQFDSSVTKNEIENLKLHDIIIKYNTDPGLGISKTVYTQIYIINQVTPILIDDNVYELTFSKQITEELYINEGFNIITVNRNYNTTNGNYSHVEGLGTVTNNEAEHAQGKYNVSTVEKTLSSVGYGDIENRKNAFEITVDGLSYFTGVGNYSGNNLTSAQSLQEVINNIFNEIQYNSSYKIENNINSINLNINYKNYIINANKNVNISYINITDEFKKSGKETIIIIKNISDTPITITMPTGLEYINLSINNLQILPKRYGEVSILWINGIGYIRWAL